ncbi:MAG: enoyl-CoA hydratase-related protein [Pseudomonadota bacterium]
MSTFDLTLEDGIAHLTLNRPDSFNSMTKEFWSDLPATVTELSEGGEARVLVLSSTGKHFCAGMDLSVFSESEDLSGKSELEAGRAREVVRHLVASLQETFTSLERARMPVLAAIQGGCIGGAVDMVTACCSRYVTREAFFCIQEINIGMMADVGTFPRLCHLMPEGLVRELAYTGRRLSADEALACGLVNKIYDDQEAMMDGVMGVAREIASRTPLAVTGSKYMITYSRDHSVRDTLEHVQLWQSGMFQPADMLEAMTAKVEKRPASFDNLGKIRKAL